MAGRWASESNALGLTRGHPYRLRHGRRPLPHLRWLRPSGSTKPTRLCTRQMDGRRRPRCCRAREQRTPGPGPTLRGQVVARRIGPCRYHLHHRRRAQQRCCGQRTADRDRPVDNQVGHALEGGSIRWLHGGKVQDRVVGDSTAVGVTELRARRSGVAHGRIAPGVQAATIQPWPKTFRPSSLTAVFAMRPNRLARRFSAPATRALASSAGSTGSRGSFSRNASLAAQRWSALQPVTPWSDGTI